MNTTLKGISSMATRQVLAQITAAYEAVSGQRVQIEPMGGVDAVKHVQANEPLDIVLLASDAIDKLIASGHLLLGSRCDWVRSAVAVCVPARASEDAAYPDISSGEAVKQAVLAARSIGYSTGPSGVQLVKQFERWDIAQQIASRVVIAPPGVPVASLVAKGEVALGFQQLSELLSVSGIEIIGTLPDDIQITTLFSTGISTNSMQLQAALKFQNYLLSPETAILKHQNGMWPL
jgi:molybdate transport system substrate-binding protein